MWWVSCALRVVLLRVVFDVLCVVWFVYGVCCGVCARCVLRVFVSARLRVVVC